MCVVVFFLGGMCVGCPGQRRNAPCGALTMNKNAL